MNLRQQASAHLAAILHDTRSGFAWPIVIVSPDGRKAQLSGFTQDIPYAIDPETGLAVSGRTASIALYMKDLEFFGSSLPKAEPDETKKPWVVSFKDPLGGKHNFKVMSSKPDRTIGLLVCMLELHEVVA